jgi:CheY-like chemotaxis protein
MIQTRPGSVHHPYLPETGGTRDTWPAGRRSGHPQARRKLTDSESFRPSGHQRPTRSSARTKQEMLVFARSSERHEPCSPTNLMPPVSPRGQDTAPRRPVIVLAEDDPALRQLIAGALELDGHRVIQVATGGALMTAVQDIVVHGAEGGNLALLISDVRMPELSGLDALKLLRDAELRIPIILITAFSDLWTRTEAARYGARLLDKPLELRVLRKVVRDSLAV